jgi:hypothetical protein
MIPQISLLRHLERYGLPMKKKFSSKGLGIFDLLDHLQHIL